jgi:chitodextrinase
MDYQSYTTTELVALANAFAQVDELAGDPAMPADLPALLAEHMALDADGRATQLAELSSLANVATVAEGVENPLDLVTPLLTDEQAEQVPNAYPEWETGVAYKVGDRRRYDGRLYRCVQAHTSQANWTPDKVPALWVRTSQEGEIPDWVQPTGAHDAYAKGDKVRHGGKVWESTMDANVYEPGVYGWTEA